MCPVTTTCYILRGMWPQSITNASSLTSSVACLITQAYVLKTKNALSLTLQQIQCYFYFCSCAIQGRKWAKTGPKFTHHFHHTITSFYTATQCVWQAGTAGDLPTGSHFHLPRPWPKHVQFSMWPSS